MDRLRLQIIYAIFIAILVGVNLTGTKIINIYDMRISVGIFMVPFSFLITDIVEEVYGKDTIKHFIIGGIISLIIVFSFLIIFVNLEPHKDYIFDKEYKTIFSNSIRMVIATIIAFSISQIHDAIAFDWWKKKTNGKALWLRNNLSTAVSQFIDTFVFMMIAFYHLTPKFTLSFIISLSIPYYIFKMILGFINTPLVYLGVKWLKDEKARYQKDNFS